MIKQESDESGIVAEFQDNGPPLLKKIKQEVNTRFFGRNNPAVFVPCGQLDVSGGGGRHCVTTPLFIKDFHIRCSYEVLPSCRHAILHLGSRATSISFLFEQKTCERV